MAGIASNVGPQASSELPVATPAGGVDASADNVQHAAQPVHGDADSEQQQQGKKAKKSTKRKYALHLGYLGAGYHGMQRNPGLCTIESELEAALVRAGAISEANAGSFMKIHWMRAARTDKGVSAACQVVSAKLLGEPIDTFCARVNQQLPAEIRIFGVQRATEGFDARKFCDKRRYEYILPAWVFDPAACGRGVKEAVPGSGASGTAPSASKLARLRAEVAASRCGFTFDDAALARLNDVLGTFVGTHNFHNYTVKVYYDDPAAKRFIHSFTAERMIISGEPWLKLVVVGQSFMLHQIRKMVGMTLAIMRNVAPLECLVTALDPDRDLTTPMAPELGLFLDETYYDSYNRRFGELHGPVSFEPFRETAEAFKRDVLYPHIAEKDEAELINALWLTCCTDAEFKFSRWECWRKQRNHSQTPAAAGGDDNGKRRHDGPGISSRSDAGAAQASAPKQQRLERPGRLQGASAAMVVGMQETYGMAPHRDTPVTAMARQELHDMRAEHAAALAAEEAAAAAGVLNGGDAGAAGTTGNGGVTVEQQQHDVHTAPEEALDELYDMD